MAFCARYDNRSKYLNEIDEIIIPFHDSDNNLAEFLDAHSKQRVIVDIKGDWRPFFAAIFTPIAEKYTNIALRFSQFNESMIPALQQIKIPYFSAQPIVEWELLNELLKQGVSDVYISGQLGFELEKVARVVAPYGARIRVYPNVVQTARQNTDALKKFFIRPEDVDLYNRRYISTFEFYIPNGVDLNWDILYDAYAINKKWSGPLFELIVGLDSDINNMYISPKWGEFRINCERNCLKGKNCNMCNTIYELSKSLQKLEVMPRPPKDTKETAKKIMQKIDSKKIDAEPPHPTPKMPNF